MQSAEAWESEATAGRQTMFGSHARLIGVTLASGLVLTVATVAYGQNAPNVVWKFGHENRETVPAAKAAHILADEVAKKTGGHFKIEIYPAGQLGKEAQLVEQLQLGTVQMTFSPTAPLRNFETRMQLLDLPFL